MQQFQYATQSKIVLRKESKEIRVLLLKEGKLDVISRQIVDNLLVLDDFKRSRNVLLFYPKEDEIDLRGLLCKDKNFFLPRCNGKNLDICPFKNENDLALGAYGIYEPTSPPISDLTILDIIFIPALCADRSFNRIGYGGGFYDRFLSNQTLRAKKITVIPDELLYENVPTIETDIKSDLIVTQSLTISCNIS